MKTGYIASEGLGIGKVKRFNERRVTLQRRIITDIEKNLQDFASAIKKSQDELEEIKASVQSTNPDFVAIFDAHIYMINDPVIKTKTTDLIKSESLHPAYAYQLVTAEVIKTFENLEDAYFKARLSDVKDIQQRVINHLLERDVPDTRFDEAVIIVAHDLTPSDTAKLDLKFVKGFITEVGGTTSHTAIMARALNLPAMVGVREALSKYQEGDMLILDCDEDEIIINPDDKTLEAKRQAYEDNLKNKETLKAYSKDKSLTKDQFHIPLYANVASQSDIKKALEVGAEGIGLYRTEYLFMGRKTPPSEEEQFEAYKIAFEATSPVMIRTLDLGGDKGLEFIKLEEEENPFLGFRAIRLCLEEKRLFQTQLRAILRASYQVHEAHIILPMIARMDELKKAKKQLELAKESLDNEGINYQKNIRLGIMIEVPAVALNASRFAKEVDFFSIGTNDLVQYMYAADRLNAKVSYLNEPLDPSFLKVLQHIIDAGHKENIPVGLCGEAASDLATSLLLVGMGIDELSMNPSQILPIRKILKDYDSSQLRDLADQALALESYDEVKDLMKQFLK